MRKIVFFTVFFAVSSFFNCFNSNKLTDLDIKSEKSFYANEFYSNINEALFYIQEYDELLYNLLNSFAGLTNFVIKNDAKNIDELSVIFSDLVVYLLEIVEFRELDNTFIYLNQIKKAKESEQRKIEVKKLFIKNSVDQNKKFISEIFILSFDVFKKEIKLLLEDFCSEIIFYLEGDLQDKKGAVMEELVFRRNKKKRRIASAIFCALAKACVSLAQILTGKSKDDTKEGFLNLAGNAFNLAAEINDINTEEVRSISSTREFMIVVCSNFSEMVYKLIKENDVPVGKKYSSWIDALDSLSGAEKRQEWLRENFESFDLGQKLITSVLKCFKKCLNNITSLMLEALKEKVIDCLNYYEKQKNIITK